MPKSTKSKKSEEILEAEDCEETAGLPNISVDCMEEMFTRLTSVFTLSFNTCMTKMVEVIGQKLTPYVWMSTQERFSTSTNAWTEPNNKLMNLKSKTLSSKHLSRQYRMLLTRQEPHSSDIDQYSRSDNLLIHGIPYPSDGSGETNMEKRVVDVLKANISGINLSESDISVAHRIGRQPTPPSPSSPSQPPPTLKPQPIVVRFTRRTVRNAVLANRKQLKGKKISVTEQLTQGRAQLLKKANELVKDQHIESAWSHDGRILVKGANNKIVNITVMDDFGRF